MIPLLNDPTLAGQNQGSPIDMATLMKMGMALYGTGMLGGTSAGGPGSTTTSGSYPPPGVTPGADDPMGSGITLSSPSAPSAGSQKKGSQGMLNYFDAMAKANPYDPTNAAYLKRRAAQKVTL